jgi:hypothetical protein
MPQARRSPWRLRLTLIALVLLELGVGLFVLWWGSGR